MQNSQQNESKKQQDYLKKMKHDYEQVFSTPAGKRVLADILVSGMVKRRIFSGDVAVMAHREGARNLALHIEEMATPEPEKSPKSKEAIK